MNDFEWKILQDQYSDDALQLLGRYSDITFEKVMKSVQYLEYRSERELLLIKLNNIEKVTIGIQIPSYSGMNFRTFTTETTLNSYDLKGYKSFKKVEEYIVKREQEIFRLIEAGYNVIDSKAFNQVNLLRQKQLN